MGLELGCRVSRYGPSVKCFDKHGSGVPRSVPKCAQQQVIQCASARRGMVSPLEPHLFGVRPPLASAIHSIWVSVMRVNSSNSAHQPPPQREGGSDAAATGRWRAG